MRYKAVIFDLDGTLLDTLSDLAASTNRALVHFDLPERSIDEVRRFVGDGVEKLIRRAVPEDTGEELIQDCLAWFKRDYMVHMRDHTAPYPGILDLLHTLESHGCKMGVVSNKLNNAVKALCQEHFGDLISIAVGDRSDMQKKPARDLVDLCMFEMNIQADGCVYVGDSEVDIQTAANAGLPCLSVSWGFRSQTFLKDKGASIIFNIPEALLTFLLNEE